MRNYNYGSILFGQSLMFGVVAIAIGLALQGCSDRFKDAMVWSDAGGYEDVILDLPFGEGYQSLCTQGTGGTYSHDATSTENDLDFDTPNGENDLVYAPIGGVASVHTESASRNFGYHVNIDRGNGTYVVIAHLAEIFIEDGSEVATGQMIGYEGCTGACTGDHVHVGLHEGDADSMAEFGRSQSVSYYLDDATSGEEGEIVAAPEIVCGTSGGHVYQSKLEVTTWHPNGSLVKTPDDANVYLIEDGTRRWIETEEVFWSLGYDFRDVALISPDELNCYDVGASIDTAEEPPSAFTSDDGATTLHEGDLVREESTSDVYVVSDGVAMPIESWDVLLKLGWGERPILTVADGAVKEIVGAVGSCSADYWCVTEAASLSCATEGSVELGQGGTDEEEEDTGTNDASSMLEGEIEDGEFGLVFLPPEGYAAESAELVGSATTKEGETLFTAQSLGVSLDGGIVVYATKDLPPESIFDFSVTYSDGMTIHTSCEKQGDGYELKGTLYAVYGSEVLNVVNTEQMVNERECLLRTVIPGYTEQEDTGDGQIDETVDTGDPDETVDEDTGESETVDDREVEICYEPGVIMSGGDLYLDGGFFTNWDSDPADSAASGDTSMCATVEAVSGEEVKMNAWFMERGVGVVEWAAYNNWCNSIDWQGTITVDGTSVSVVTAPWSAADWASDPCNTGGDAFFNVP